MTLSDIAWRQRKIFWGVADPFLTRGCNHIIILTQRVIACVSTAWQFFIIFFYILVLLVLTKCILKSFKVTSPKVQGKILFSSEKKIDKFGFLNKVVLNFQKKRFCCKSNFKSLPWKAVIFSISLDLLLIARKILT